MLISKLFSTKTKFMDYLLDKMLTNSDEKQSDNPEISLLLLNMFKTLIDNNLNILKITQEQLWGKISNHEVISALILGRTKFGVGVLKRLLEEEQMK